MGKSASQPTPPDPYRTAEAQTQSNVKTATANALLNRTGQYTPLGNMTWQQTGVDPATGVPLYASKVSLDPTVQQALTANNQLAAQMGQAGTGYFNNVKNQLMSPINTSGLPGIASKVGSGNLDAMRQQAQDAIYNRQSSMLDPQYNQQQEQLQSQLAQQGITQGSAAYNNAMNNFARQRDFAYSQARDASITGGNDYANQQFMQGLQGANLQNQAQSQGLSQLFSLREQPLNELQAFRSGSQVAMPTFNGSPAISLPGTDISGNIYKNYQAAVNNANAEQATNNSNTQALAGLAAAAMMAFSDKRLKKDIEPTGETLNGHNLYSFRYKGAPDDSPKTVGVMAQEVEKTRPDAVFKNPDGVRVVNYGAL